jgi:hypothetical protein
LLSAPESDVSLGADLRSPVGGGPRRPSGPAGARPGEARSFVAHYCNARSYVPWDDEPLGEGEMGNGRHVLARGQTHLPYAQPRFRTPCAANGFGA